MPSPYPFAFITAGLVWLLSQPAAAQESAASAACARLRAEAASRASLLVSPAARVQGLRLPGQGDTDGLGLVQQRGYQVRALVEWPLVDLYRAGRVRGIAEGQCTALSARVEVERNLQLGSDLGKLEAAQALLSELESHDQTVSTILRDAEARHSHGVITAAELDALRLLALELRLRKSTAREDATRLRAQPPASRNLGDVSAALARYEQGLGASERDASRLRRAEALHVDVAGGVIPDRQVDWFASVSVSYDLGGVAQGEHERRGLVAAQAERRNAEYELGARVSRLRAQILSRVAALRDSLDVLELKRRVLQEQRDRLARGEPREAIEQRARIDLELVSLAGERAYASALLEHSLLFLESDHDRDSN